MADIAIFVFRIIILKTYSFRSYILVYFRHIALTSIDYMQYVSVLKVDSVDPSVETNLC